MRERNQFNFEKEIERLYPSIKITEEMLDSKTIPQLTQEYNSSNVIKDSYMLPLDDEKSIQGETTHAAMLETTSCIIYALAFAKESQSLLMIEVVKKTTGRTSTKKLKKLELQISCLYFLLGEDNQINLLVATNCGRLLVYSRFEQEQLTIHCARISTKRITNLLAPTTKNVVFVLSDAGIIYLVNFQECRIYYQFRCPLPLIENPRPRLIIDLSEKYIGHVFGYGRIILWEIPEEIKAMSVQKSLNNLTNDLSDTADRMEATVSTDLKSKKTKFLLKSKMSISNCLLQGILWCDFLGLFIIVISHEGKMRILAINVNRFNETQQFYTIISSYQICQQKKEGNFEERQTFADAIRLKESNGIIVGKNVEFTNNGKKTSKCFLEKYSFDIDFKVSKVLVISLTHVTQMDQFLLNHNYQYWLIRNSKHHVSVRNRNKVLMN